MDTQETPPVVDDDFTGAAVCWLFAFLIPACFVAVGAFLWLTRLP